MVLQNFKVLGIRLLTDFAIQKERNGYLAELSGLYNLLGNMTHFVWTPQESGARNLAEVHAEIIGAESLAATLRYAYERRVRIYLHETGFELN
jgi:hypothetical protein